jgi:hypothetical protein
MFTNSDRLGGRARREYDGIRAADMIVDHSVYGVTWGANPAVRELASGLSAEAATLALIPNS